MSPHKSTYPRCSDALVAEAHCIELVHGKLLRAFADHHRSLPDAKRVAPRLGVSVPTVYRWARSGRLQAADLGCRCVRFSEADVRRAEEAMQDRPARKPAGRRVETGDGPIQGAA